MTDGIGFRDESAGVVVRAPLRERVIKILETCEWSLTRCPICNAPQQKGHYAGCKLDSILFELQGDDDGL